MKDLAPWSPNGFDDQRPGAHGGRAGPQRITPTNGPWPLHATTASKSIEAATLARHAPHALMERAGLAVAKLARALAPTAHHVEVWCGPGNNGGDGYVAALRLHRGGTPAVRVWELGAPEHLPADAAEARRQALAAGVSLAPATAAPATTDTPPDLVIDALLGLGTSRAPQGTLADAIVRINARGAPVLAIDLPSGLNADTGQPWGEAVVRADHTLALLTLKPGQFTARGRDLCGQVWLDVLGNADAWAQCAPSAQLLGPAHRTRWAHAAHKGSRGDVWVVGGATGMAGAAHLAARAALAAGAGRVYVTALGPGADLAFDPGRPELMQRPFPVPSAERDALMATATVVAGCGGGAAIREQLPALLARCARLVLDADALNHIALEPAWLRLLAGRDERGQGTVLTPHPLEAARLLGSESGTVQADRLQAARHLAQMTQAVVVLKGSGSIIATPAAVPYVNPSGNASLATAGSGDVLAGWLGGLWAQRPDGPAQEVAAAAVWQHGHAADVARPHAGAESTLPWSDKPMRPAAGAPLLAADLIEALAASA